MIYTFITAIVFIALIATGAAFLIYGFVQKAKNTGKRIIPVAVPAAMIAVGLILVILIPGSFHTVEAGSVALVKQLGVIVDVEQPGTYFDFYLTRKYEEYDVKVQQVEIQTEAYTADAQSMDISMVLQFQIDSAKVEEIAVNYGSLEALTNRIQSVAVERTKATLSQYQAEKLIEERDRVSPKVQTVINEEMQKKEYCVTFNSTVLTDITFSEAFEAAVEAKMMAQQEKLQAQYENEKKKEQAEAALYVAEQEAKALVAKAQAEADAQVALAQSDARAIMLKSVEIARMLGYTVNQTTVEEEVIYDIVFDEQHTGSDIADYLKYVEYISKWDGKLPQVVTGENGFMITVPMPNSWINQARLNAASFIFSAAEKVQRDGQNLCSKAIQA